MAGVPRGPKQPSIYDNDPTYRMSMLPFGTYADDSGQDHLGFALPGMITEPINAMNRLAQNSLLPDGSLGIPEPSNPENQQDVLTGLLSLYGGNALKGMRTAAEGAVAAYPLQAPSASIRAYHGTSAPVDFPKFTPNGRKNAAYGEAVYASREPRVANHFAEWSDDYSGAPDRARVYPIDISGPLLGSDEFSEIMRSARGDVNAAKRAVLELGYTGVDGGDGLRGIAVYKPGSIRSSTTGETLFSDTGKPSLLGSALAGMKDQAQAGYRHLRYRNEPTAFGSIPDLFVGDLMPPDAALSMWSPYSAGAKRMNENSAEYLADAAKGNIPGHMPGDQLLDGTVVQPPNDLGFGPLTPYDQSALDQAWRKKVARTGELYSDTGLPSLFGGLNPQENEQPRNSFPQFAEDDLGPPPGDYLKNREPTPRDYQSIPAPDAQKFKDDWIRRYRAAHPGATYEDGYRAYFKSPEYKEKSKATKRIPLDQVPDFIPHE